MYVGGNNRSTEQKLKRETGINFGRNADFQLGLSRPIATIDIPVKHRERGVHLDGDRF
jgi:hypothetical protein